jgi:hypothetical protein
MDIRSRLSNLERHYALLPTGSAPEPVQSLLQVIMDFRQVLWRTNLEVTFFGAFKAGKSTLINALLGEAILPSRANRATGVITKIGYGEQKQVSILRRIANNQIAEEIISYEELARYILLDVTNSTAKAPEGVEAVSIQLPRTILKQGCTLVDTPGLMDDRVLTEKSYQELKKSDLAVMVLSADKLLSQREKEAIVQVNDFLNGNIVFIVNRLDSVEEEERAEILDWAKAGLVGVGNFWVGQPRLFATQAEKALAARQKGSKLGSALEGLLSFEQWLERLVSHPIGQKIAILSRLGILKSHLTKALYYFQSELTQAQQLATTLHQAQVEALEQQEANFRQIIREDRARLNHLRNQLDQWGEMFVQDCTTLIKSLMDTEPDWAEKLHGCLTPAIQAYTQRVYQGIQSKELNTQIEIPVFFPSLSNTEIADVENPAETWGTWMGIVLGIAAPGAWFIGAPIGAVVGNWLGKVLFEEEIQQKTLASVELMARSLLPMLRAESERYLNEVDRLLIDCEQSYNPQSQDLPALLAAQHTKQYYHGLVSWCDQFLNAINQIRLEVE